MQKLLFFSRVAFICNACFVLTWFLQHSSFSGQGYMASTIVILGVGLALFLNIAVCAWFGWRWWVKKNRPADFPRWLIIVNFLFLILQLIVFFA